ncbi:MAG: beta-N-acetylhexosaminidase [Alphaproteobacteria bacterium]
MGLHLSPEEKAFFAKVRPIGLILFARNCATPEQIRTLINEFRAAVGMPQALVLIDQEGGRVQRLRPPYWRAYPPAAAAANLAAKDLKLGKRATYLQARLIASELQLLGISVACAPVLDIPIPGAHDVIGDRALGSDAETVAMLGREVCEGLLDGGVLPVLKHMPGHGRSRVDSHFELPIVDAPAADLAKTDFLPFRKLNPYPLGMTAHVVYTAFDDQNPATVSNRIISEIIRGEIGFDGLLMSDDLSMRALKGDFTDRARKSLDAGCDVILHCNGNMGEMQAIIGGIHDLSGLSARRLERAQALIKPPKAFDAEEAWNELSTLLGLEMSAAS